MHTVSAILGPVVRMHWPRGGEGGVEEGEEWRRGRTGGEGGVEEREEWRRGRTGGEGGVEEREEWRRGRTGGKGGLEKRKENAQRGGQALLTVHIIQWHFHAIPVQNKVRVQRSS